MVIALNWPKLAILTILRLSVKELQVIMSLPLYCDISLTCEIC